MKGLGTIINVLCILGGGTAGYLAGNRLKEPMRETLMDVTGVGVLMLGGAGGAMAQMLTISGGEGLASSGTIMMVVSLAVGAVIGELLQIEERVVRFGSG